MAQQTTPLSALGRSAYTARDAAYVGRAELSQTEAAMRDGDITGALTAAQNAATRANELVASLTAAHLLLTTMDLADSTLVEQVREKFVYALDN